MNNPTVRGIVHLIEDTKTYGQKGFRKRLVVLEQEQGRYTNFVPLEFTQERCDKVDGLNVGDDVEVSYELRGRKWQRDENSEVKFFLNAEATEYKVVQAASAGSSGDDPGPDPFDETEAYDEDDVPF